MNRPSLHGCIRLCQVFFCLGLLVAGPATPQPFFTNVTEEVVPFSLFEARGMSFGDYNNDGWPDLFLTEAVNFIDDGGDRVALLHNGGQGRFAYRPGVLPADLLHFNPRSFHGETYGTAVFGDYDRDGDADLYLPLGAFWLIRRNMNALLRNDRGVFTDVSREAGLTEELSSTGALWLDYDRDGYLDLYVTNEATVRVDLLSQKFENHDPSAHNRLYRNNRDGSFTDVNAAAGLEVLAGLKYNVMAPDVNDDGWPDLYVGVHLGRNRLFLNGGQGEFQDATTDEIGDPGLVNGVAVGDIDNDGDLDLFQATAGHLVANAPFRSVMLLNLGAGEFLDVTENVGLNTLSNISVHHSTLADLDNDGDLDLVTGRPAFLFLNNGEGRFTEATAAAGIPPSLTGTGLVAGDYDRDGCLDLVYGGETSHDNQFGGVYRNICNENHYLRVELVGGASNRNGLGARISACAGTLRQTRELLGGSGSYQNEPVAHFGLGPHTQIDTLEVRWPSGQIDVHTGLPADQQIRLFEGEAGYHVVEPTRWEHTLPDTIEVGTTLTWEARVQPALFAPDARIERVTADLSAWGGPAAMPLVLGDDGTYRLYLENRPRLIT